MSFSIDMLDIKDLEAELRTFAKRALPFATKQTINEAAWDGRKEMQELIRRKMVERNKWTQKSIRVEQARTLVIKNQVSKFGSLEKYMIIQEEGGTERAKGKHGVSIPTGYSAGQEGQRPRTRLPRKAHKMRNIRLTKGSVKARSRKQRNFLLVTEAKKRGDRYVFLDLGRRKGVFRVLGGKKNIKIKMVADISHKSVTIKPTPTLKPSLRIVTRRMDEHYKKALLFQIRRAGIFK